MNSVLTALWRNAAVIYKVATAVYYIVVYCSCMYVQKSVQRKVDVGQDIIHECESLLNCCTSIVFLRQPRRNARTNYCREGRPGTQIPKQYCRRLPDKIASNNVFLSP